MASAWAESGIDWGNLQNYSPRDIVRELYIATSERDYWIKNFCSGGFISLDELDSIDYDASERHRTKSQIDYICETILRWLSDMGFYNPYSSGSNPYNGTIRGCMVNYNKPSSYKYEDYTLSGFVDILPYAQETFNLSWETFNYEDGGDYESLIGSSLVFLRMYSNHESFRFTYEMMFSVFNILNKMDYVRAYSLSNIKKCVPSYTNPAQNCVRLVEGYNINMRYQDDDGYFSLRYDQPYLTYPDNQPKDFNTKRQQLYDTARTNNTVFQSGGLYLWGANYIPTAELWQMRSTGNYCRFNYKGFNGNVFNTNDFDYKNLNLSFGYSSRNNTNTPIGGDSYIEQPQYDMPSSQNVWEIKDNDIDIINNDGDGVTPSKDGYHLTVGLGRKEDGDIPFFGLAESPTENNYIDHSLPLINFNKEGFLKYYTETP